MPVDPIDVLQEEQKREEIHFKYPSGGRAVNRRVVTLRHAAVDSRDQNAISTILQIVPSFSKTPSPFAV